MNHYLNFRRIQPTTTKSIISLILVCNWMLTHNPCHAFIVAQRQPHLNPVILTVNNKATCKNEIPISYRNINLHAVPPTITLTSAAAAATASGINSHFLVRILFLRGLGLVYLTAFLVALHQNKALIGDNGITPAKNILDNAEERAKLKRERRNQWLDTEYRSQQNNKMKQLSKCCYRLFAKSWFQNAWDRQDRMGRPLISLLWFCNNRYAINPWLDFIALLGIVLSSSLLLLGSTNVPILFTLWLCQRSLMSVGGPWYGYGWEPQLAELTFHALFLVPLLSLNPFAYPSPPQPVLVCIRWYLFRIMLGAGLIKFRSRDPKWRLNQLSVMQYFYETQPVPNPFSKYFHGMGQMWHKVEVLMNHFVECIAPWGMIVPGLGRKVLIWSGLVQLMFQAVLICSGNLSFLNWLTMLPAIFCLDDAFVSPLFTRFNPSNTIPTLPSYTPTLPRQITTVSFTLLISILSIPVIKNLLSKQQIMNSSFDPLRLVNTYGAFGVVNEERIELIVESSPSWNGPWKEYEFKVKPSNITKPPKWISPYHYRLDWQMWIASSTGSIERNRWMYRFLYRLLQGDKDVLALLENDPWEGEEERPKYIRVETYRYKFNMGRKKGSSKGPYWVRERVGKYFPRQGIASESVLKDLIGER